MKNRTLALGSVILTLLLGSCSVTNKLTMNAINPAPVTLSKGVQRIGILNRSLPSKSNTTADKIDKILSAEGRNLDAEGSEAAILALMEQLRQNESIEEIVSIENQPHFFKRKTWMPKPRRYFRNMYIIGQENPKSLKNATLPMPRI